MKLTYTASKEIIVKEYLQELGLSKKFCKRVKLYGKILINGEEAKNYYLLKPNDELTLILDEELNQDIVPINQKLDIIYEDEYILVINKPYGLSVQPSRKHYLDNLISLVKNYYINNGINSNIHVVNRLDYATSGLVIIAKDGLTHYKMSTSILEKKYYAIVHGNLENKEDEIVLPIKRMEESNIKRMVSPDGKYAKTIYKVIEANSNYSLLDVNLITGRTHQIRVHFSYLGNPLVGDKLYGDDEFGRLYLHCYKLVIKHPYTNEEKTFECNNQEFFDFFTRNK